MFYFAKFQVCAMRLLQLNKSNNKYQLFDKKSENRMTTTTAI